MDECIETIPTWKIFTWLGIGFFAALVIWFTIDTCYDIQQSETEEEIARQSAKSRRSSQARSEPRSTCNTPKSRRKVITI